MDLALLALAIAIVAAAVIVAFAVTRRALPSAPPMTAPDPRLDTVIAGQGEIAGQFKQTVATQTALQKTLSERIDALSQRLGESLKDSATKTAETLGGIQARLSVIDEAQRNISALSGQVTTLQAILSDKQARGAWGEYRMEDIIRDQLPPNLYNFTGRLSNNRQPDCIIRMPNVSAVIVIDAKFPLEGFETMRTASSDEERKNAVALVRASVLKHVKDINDRYLIAGEVQTPLIMFVPSESIYAELDQNFGDVIQKSRQSQVVILSPHVLWLAVNTIRAVVRDAEMAENAEQIRSEVGLLLEDVTRLGKRVGNLRSHFLSANEDITEIETSMRKISNRATAVGNVQFEKPDEPPALPTAKLI